MNVQSRLGSTQKSLPRRSGVGAWVTILTMWCRTPQVGPLSQKRYLHNRSSCKLGCLPLPSWNLSKEDLLDLQFFFVMVVCCAVSRGPIVIITTATVETNNCKRLVRKKTPSYCHLESFLQASNRAQVGYIYKGHKTERGGYVWTWQHIVSPYCQTGNRTGA